MALNLRNIPSIMRLQGWTSGAVLLDKWFSRPATIAPRFTAADTTTVRMDSFVLTYSRIRQFFQEAVMNERIWENDASKGQLVTVLRRNGYLPAYSSEAFDFTTSAQAQHENHINTRSFSRPIDWLDGFTCAVGNFSFHVLPAGYVEPVPEVTGLYNVVVETVGIYLHDTFDFTNRRHLGGGHYFDQPLGYWDDLSMAAGRPTWASTGSPNGEWVTNSTFQRWRRANAMGGDFEIFSDVKLIPLRAPVSFRTT